MMYKLIAFGIFWLAVGMLLMLLIGNRLVGLILIFLMLLICYNLMFCKK